MSLWLRDRECAWPVGRIKDHVELINGWPFESSRFNSTVGTPVIRIRDLLKSKTETFYDGEVLEHVMVRDGDLIVGMDGDFNGALWQGGPAALNQRLCLLRARQTVDQRFLAYFISIPLRTINDVTYFTTVKHLSSVDLLNERMPLPRLSEQRVIADFLDAETARIDALIAKKHRMRELLQERFLATIDEMTKELEAIPLLRVAVVTYGLGQPPPVSEDGVPILRATNISQGIITSKGLIRARLEDLPLERAPLLKAGEILVVRSGAYTGDSALITEAWEGAAPGYDLRVTPTSVDSRFLALQMLGRRFLDQVDLAKGRAAQPHLNAEELGRIKVMVASDRVEATIGETLHSLDQQRRALEDLLIRQIDLLAEHRQALITAAVSGELNVAESIAEAAS